MENLKEIRPMKDEKIDRIRSDFPVLHEKVNGKPLTYLDNAATTLKPKIVAEVLNDYYQKDYLNASFIITLSPIVLILVRSKE